MKTIKINNYKKYWISDTKHGHMITICHGAKDKVLKLDLRWDDGYRDKNNRVIRKHSVSQPE
mgnify:FL=1